MQTKNGDTWRRLEIENTEDNVRFFKSTDGGTTWQTVRTLLTNADLDGRIVLLSGGSTALEASSGNTRFRLQLNTNGNVTLYRSTDGGSTWPESKKVATWN